MSYTKTSVRKHKQINLYRANPSGDRLWLQFIPKLKRKIRDKLTNELWWPIWDQFEFQLGTQFKLELEAFVEGYEET